MTKNEDVAMGFRDIGNKKKSPEIEAFFKNRKPKPNSDIANTFRVKVDTKALYDYFPKYFDKETCKFAQDLYLEIADSFETFAENFLEKRAKYLLRGAMMEWDI